VRRVVNRVAYLVDSQLRRLHSSLLQNQPDSLQRNRPGNPARHPHVSPHLGHLHNPLCSSLAYLRGSRARIRHVSRPTSRHFNQFQALPDSLLADPVDSLRARPRCSPPIRRVGNRPLHLPTSQPGARQRNLRFVRLHSPHAGRQNNPLRTRVLSHRHNRRNNQQVGRASSRATSLPCTRLGSRQRCPAISPQRGPLLNPASDQLLNHRVDRPRGQVSSQQSNPAVAPAVNLAASPAGNQPHSRHGCRVRGPRRSLPGHRRHNRR
jgi:hypothetical protein